MKLDCVAQQRDVTPRLTITRFRSGVSSMAISLRPSASLMAARALALPMLARSAIRATGCEHFPLAWASLSGERGADEPAEHQRNQRLEIG